MVPPRPSQWPELFDIAVRIISHATASIGFEPAWSFGGGTALMLQINHRESHDIDLFLDDPQLLPYLNPETQEIDLKRLPDSYQTDGVRVLKLAYQELGEIDFICAGSITQDPTTIKDVRGQHVALEKPAEIIAKKVYYRGSSFQPRDMFDLAAVVERCGADCVVSALAQCGVRPCTSALKVVLSAKPDFVVSIMNQLVVRDETRDLADRAQGTSREILERTLREMDSAKSP